ncbi:tryptophan halogenase family protein [Pseudoalteromonas sp. T1lg23B]|uniref:tryptophan halogenase family protein n=1 Tax=Pseudoalteromonas sp. T1lg23B TaxID=2077097 RepID=UPI000CF632FC|nr:tryptophan halogenase family protein [Pseudoalteromonas sp. T1lg23B]
MTDEIKKIVIVGGGTTGWMAAASLSRYAQGKDLTITLIESPDINTVGVGEATIPNFVDFNRQLGIADADLIKATQATFKLGIEFEDWYQKGSRFFHPFAAYGAPLENVEFHQYINKLKTQGVTQDIEDYCFACVLAKKGAFAAPNEQSRNSINHYAYAYHIDAVLYARFLTQFCKERGVCHILSTVSQVTLNAQSGMIESLKLNDGQIIDGDLFIDCSGFKGVLIEGAMGVGLEEDTHWLPCDSAVAVQTELQDTPTPYTRAIAKEAGWQWCIPLQHRMGNGYIYSSKFISDEQAKESLLNSVKGRTITEVKHFKFPKGRRKVIWHKNCFALGLAAGFLEPLESLGISLIQTALAKLLTFFPDKSFNQADINEVNRLHNSELDCIIDFLLVHYKLTQRDDTAFWRHCQQLPIPQSLAHKLAVYQSQGHVVQYANESFQQASWLAMFYGFNLQPERFDARIKGLDNHLIEKNLVQLKAKLATAASQCLSHQAFINQHCKALSDV